jgi:hypothetical protein
MKAPLGFHCFALFDELPRINKPSGRGSSIANANLNLLIHLFALLAFSMSVKKIGKGQRTKQKNLTGPGLGSARSEVKTRDNVKLCE